MWPNYRSSTVKFLGISLIISRLAICPCYPQQVPQLPIDDPKKLIDVILPAIKSIDYPASGRGTAILQVGSADPNQGGVWKLDVDFLFKDDKSRADTYTLESGRRGQRDSVTVEADKCGFNMGHGYVTVRRRRNHDTSFVGADFHPKWFLKFKDLPLEYWVGSMRVDLVETTAELDKEGILLLTAQRPDAIPEESFHKIEVALDTKKGFRPLLYRITAATSDGTDGGTLVKFDWTLYDSTWYVRHAERHDYWPGFKRSRQFSVTSFHPNAPVSDEEFTLQGLNIPEGTPIYDKIAGLEYAYGSPVRSTADLETVLDNASFVNKIQKSPNEADAQDSDANSKPAGDMDSNEPSEQEDDAGTRPSPVKWLVVGLLSVCVIVIARWYRSRKRQS